MRGANRSAVAMSQYNNEVYSPEIVEGSFIPIRIHDEVWPAKAFKRFEQVLHVETEAEFLKEASSAVIQRVVDDIRTRKFQAELFQALDGSHFSATRSLSDYDPMEHGTVIFQCCANDSGLRKTLLRHGHSFFRRSGPALGPVILEISLKARRCHSDSHQDSISTSPSATSHSGFRLETATDFTFRTQTSDYIGEQINTASSSPNGKFRQHQMQQVIHTNDQILSAVKELLGKQQYQDNGLDSTPQHHIESRERRLCEAEQHYKKSARHLAHRDCQLQEEKRCFLQEKKEWEKALIKRETEMVESLRQREKELEAAFFRKICDLEESLRIGKMQLEEKWEHVQLEEEENRVINESHLAMIRNAEEDLEKLHRKYYANSPPRTRSRNTSSS